MNTRTDKLTFHLPTMDCPACARHVEDALCPLAGVDTVNVNVLERTVRVGGSGLDRAFLTDALTKAGYPPETPGQAEPHDRSSRSYWCTAKAYRTGAAGLLWLIAVALSLRADGLVLAEVWTWHVTPGALLAAVAAVLGATNFVPSAVRSARALNLDIHVLMSIAIAGAFVLGEFTEAAAIGFLFSLAELLESRALARARDAIRGLVELAPPTAVVVRPTGEDVVPVAEIAVGERVRVRPGDRVPLDGIVRRGESDLNEAALTGEAMPVRRSVGDEVYAGTLALDGSLEVEATRAAPDTVLARVIELVRSAQEKKARVEEFVHRFARAYTPAVVGLAGLLMIGPPLLLGQAWSTWVLRGLTLLVVACPCALVISTPVSIVSAITSAARHGVVITGGEHLEALGEVRTVAFDKTGTITRGVPRVTAVIPNGGASADEVLRVAALLETHSSHPLAHAIVAEAESRGVSSNGQDVSDIEVLPGRGMSGRINGVSCRVVTAQADGVPPSLEASRAAGHTLVQVERGGTPVGHVALADTVRPEAHDVVRALRQMGMAEITMLTGDHPDAARAVAGSVGITNVRAGCLPAEKLAAIDELRARHGGVAMVGDGINDAPALASATVGIAMGAKGSPTALDAADIALMADDLNALPYLIRLSRATRSVVRQNIWASVLIKALMLIGVPLGLVSMTLAVLVGDMGTSLAVTTNALRLARVKA